MADVERSNITLPSATANHSRRQHEPDVDMLRHRWDEGKASERAGPLDVSRILAEEREAFHGGRSRRG